MKMRFSFCWAFLILQCAGCTLAAKKEVRTLVAQEESRLRYSKATINDPPVNDYLNSLAKQVLDAARSMDGADRPNYRPDKNLDIFDNLRVWLVHDFSPNAWVVGDDFICIDTPAILLAESPEEIVFILSHEFGHMHERHSVKTVMRRYRNRTFAFIATAIIASAAAQNATNNPHYTQQQYQRDLETAQRVGDRIRESFVPYDPNDEFEADAYAVRLMWHAGYAMDQCEKFLERLAVYYGDGGSASHPPTHERVIRIRALARSLTSRVPIQHPDLSQFRRIQEQVRIQTIDALARQTICFDSIERMKGPNGRTVSALKACGPLGASAERVANQYVKLLKL